MSYRFLFFFLPAILQASPLLSLFEPIPATVLHVYDGDTLTVEIQPTLDQHICIPVRLAGIDAPELRGRCDVERLRARLARAALIEQAGDIVILTDIQAGRYYPRRIVAKVHDVSGRDIAQQLIAAGHGRTYHGRKRASWCNSNP